MFDRPGLVLLITLATLGPLVGLAIVRAMNNWKTPHGVDALFSFLTLLAVDFLNGMVISTFLAWMYDEYKKITANDDKPRLTPAEPTGARPRILLNLNNVGGVYQFNTQTVKIDHMSRKVKHFCIVLINQREQGFQIDLREQTWKGHFGGRDNWVSVRDVRMAGAFAKEESRVNSPFTVVDWKVVERGAEGRL